MANFRNLAIGFVQTPPNPPISGVTLALAPGHGARMPALPFTATVWPVTELPDPTNAEVVLVTAIVNDTLTLVRAQEGTTARAIGAGDQLAGTITAAYLASVPLETDSAVAWAGNQAIAGTLTVAGATTLNALTVGGALGVAGPLTVTGPTVLNGLTIASGDVSLAGDLLVAGVVQSPQFRGYSETWRQYAVSGGSFTVDHHAGNHAFVYLTEDVTSITIQNIPAAANQIVPVMVYYVAMGGPRAVAHVVNGHGVRFPAGQQPIMSADNGYIDRILYTTWDGGITWLGDIIGMHY